MGPSGPNTITLSNALGCVLLERCTTDEHVMTITGLSPLGPSRITGRNERGDVASVTRVKELKVCFPAHKMALRHPLMGSSIHPSAHVHSVHSIIMRPSLFLIAFLPQLASAQIPNGGFENWADQGGYLDPIGWLTYNDVVTPGGWPSTTVEQGSPGAVGAYHAVITAVAVPLGPTIQGWISAGSSSGNSGFPYTQRPGMLTGQWQYGIQPNDTAQVQVALIKWNSITNSTEPVAFGTLEVTGSLGTWQAFAVPFTYSSSETPDTAYIQIVSSVNFSDPIVGSFMKVDDLAFAGTVGIGEGRSRSTLLLFPNPGTTHIILSLPPDPQTISLFDATGRMVLQQRTNNERPVIGTEHLPAGLYRIIVQNDQGGLIGATWVKER